MISERLQKVVNMARNGIGNEKVIAERLVKRECEKLGLSYQDVISGKHDVKNDSGPFKRYSGSWSNENPYSKSSPKYDFEEAIDNINQAYNEFYRKYNEQKEMEELRRKEAERRSKTAIDKLGGKWTFVEIMKLSREKRFHLFGTDPLVGNW